MTRPYTKLPLTLPQQVQQLKDRGMVFADPAHAEFLLSQINYYRLEAYWLPFEISRDPHAFKPGTDFETAVNLYVADRELRLLFLDAIERIEVAMRTQWAYHLSHHAGAHAHLEMKLATNPSKWLENMTRLSREVERSNEIFIQHLRSTYAEMLPPVWACCEVMSFGLLSNWYFYLKPMAVRQAIAKHFGVHHDTLASWLTHLSYVRNICAHHGRLWNRQMVITPGAPKTRPAVLKGEFVTAEPDSRKIYNTMLLMLHLMDVIAPQSRWRQRLLDLLHKGVWDTSKMGFSAGWEERPIWKGAAA